MNQKQLGKSVLQSPSIMFGGNVFGWTLDKKESFRMLDMLLERGLTFIDTADVYGREMGDSEKIIGQWMKERGTRDQVTLATKIGRRHKKNAAGEIEKNIDNSNSYLKKAINKSLTRLQTAHIDLLYIHFDDQITPINDVLNTLDGMRKAGKATEFGASNFSAGRLKEALDKATRESLPKYEILQTEYNLIKRQEFEGELQPICKDNTLSVASYFSLASGFLTGKYRHSDDYKGHPREKIIDNYFSEQGLNILNTLDEVSEEHGVSNAAVSLAWILNRPDLTTCVVSATKEEHLQSFEDAVDLNLTDDNMARLNKVSSY